MTRKELEAELFRASCDLSDIVARTARFPARDEASRQFAAKIIRDAETRVAILQRQLGADHV